MTIPCANCGQWKETHEFFTIVFQDHADAICIICLPEVKEILHGLETRSRGNSEISREDAEGTRERETG